MSELSSTAAEPRRTGGAGATRDRILSVATEMFYARGVRGTSADRIIEQVGVTRVTFYRHFRTKADIVVAYLEAQAEQEKAAMTASIEEKTPVQALLAIADMIGTFSCSPGFRGCPFINAAAEFPDPEDPVRGVVRQHRQWTRELFETLSTEAGASDAEATAGHLMMLRDGAMVGGYLENPEDPSEELQWAFSAVLEAASDQTLSVGPARSR